jgi:hypothetical protein
MGEKSEDFRIQHSMDTQDKEPQVAPAVHVGAHVPVGREDLRERAGPFRPWDHALLRTG